MILINPIFYTPITGIIRDISMDIEENNITTEEYVSAMEYEYAGMINTLNYLCKEADAATLDFVRLHLNIAIDELKEHQVEAT